MENPRRTGQQSDGVSTLATPEGVSVTPGGPKNNGSHPGDRVARRAYDSFEERGREHGRDLEDWLGAEREIMLGEHR
jgi:hypothetical protein